MNSFRNAFRHASSALEDRFRKNGLHFGINDDSDRLTFQASDNKQFSFEIICFDYGIYPSAEGWHGSSWDVTVFDSNEIQDHLNELVQSLLFTAVLETKFSGKSPFKWTLHYCNNGEIVSDTTGLIFYNYFGSKRVMRQTNGIET